MVICLGGWFQATTSLLYSGYVRFPEIIPEIDEPTLDRQTRHYRGGWVEDLCSQPTNINTEGHCHYYFQCKRWTFIYLGEGIDDFEKHENMKQFWPTYEKRMIRLTEKNRCHFLFYMSLLWPFKLGQDHC